MNMIKKREDRRTEVRENLKGGNGALAFSHVFESEELSGKAKMFAEVTLMPGESIGVHQHNEEGEMYIVQSGKGTVTDNDCACELYPGDAIWTTNGDTHSISNKTTEPLVIYAIILP